MVAPDERAAPAASRAYAGVLSSAGSREPELTTVIPAYNEGAGIEGLLREWVATLDGLGIDYELVLYDDGSTDATPHVVRRLAGELPTLRLREHSNRGHGPTILRGYREARGRWVLQVDGDGEVDSGQLAALWARRDEADFVLGHRTGRGSPPHRRLISAVARWSVALLFGGPRASDVNSPCRLMRRSRLEPLLAAVPADAFAPNVVLTGLAVRRGLRVLEVPVAFRARRWGASLGSWRLWRGAAMALRDTVAIARGERAAR